MIKRGLRVTAVVATLGALGGAVGGLIVGSLWYLPRLWTPVTTTVWFDPPFWAVARFAAIWGAAAGVILGPILAWTLLRRAPLWRAVTETAVAAALGTGLALMFSVGDALLLATAVASPLAAAVRLRHEVREQAVLPPTRN